jgi:hypothetical protein
VGKWRKTCVAKRDLEARLSSENLKDRVSVHGHVCEKKRFTIDELQKVFPCFVICPLRNCHT